MTADATATMPDEQTMMGFKIWLMGQAYAGAIDAPLNPWQIPNDQIWRDYGPDHFEQFATEYSIALASWENIKNRTTGMS